MIEKELFELLRQQYSPVISNIINSDVRFYRTNQTIQWRFGYDERIAIFVCCDRTIYYRSRKQKTGKR